MTDANSVIQKFEGFRATPYWDQNNWRIGFGSDTITQDDGTVIRLPSNPKVKPDYTVTRADAERDLERRIPAFVNRGIIPYVGQAKWDRLPDDVKAAITSVAYNYGSLDGLRTLTKAIKAGDTDAMVKALVKYGSHNGGINKKRREAEAGLINGAPIPKVGMASDPPVPAKLTRGVDNQRIKFASDLAATPLPRARPGLPTDPARVALGSPVPANLSQAIAGKRAEYAATAANRGNVAATTAAGLTPKSDLMNVMGGKQPASLPPPIPPSLSPRLDALGAPRAPATWPAARADGVQWDSARGSFVLNDMMNQTAMGGRGIRPPVSGGIQYSDGPNGKNLPVGFVNSSYTPGAYGNNPMAEPLQPLPKPQSYVPTPNPTAQYTGGMASPYKPPVIPGNAAGGSSSNAAGTLQPGPNTLRLNVPYQPKSPAYPAATSGSQYTGSFNPAAKPAALPAAKPVAPTYTTVKTQVLNPAWKNYVPVPNQTAQYTGGFTPLAVDNSNRAPPPPKYITVEKRVPVTPPQIPAALHREPAPLPPPVFDRAAAVASAQRREALTAGTQPQQNAIQSMGDIGWLMKQLGNTPPKVGQVYGAGGNDYTYTANGFQPTPKTGK